MTEPDQIAAALVVGAGDMGHGIAEVLAIHGIDVHLRDVKQAALDQALARIETSLRILARKRKVKKDEVAAILARVHPCTELPAATSTILFAVEAVPEIMHLKQAVLRELDAHLPPAAIVATNTSNMSITRLGAATGRADHVVGLHFFNPAVIMKTVEVIPGEATLPAVVDRTVALVERVGKIPVHVLKDSPGFVVNRVLVAAQVLTGQAVARGIFQPAEFDAVARGMGMPQGPFETMDFVGLDVAVHGMEYFGRTLGPEYRPPAWLADLVEQGHLGKKTGHGIYPWPGGKADVDLSTKTGEMSLLDLMAVQVNEATKLLEEGVVDDPTVVDVAIKNGTANAMGVLGLLKSVGKAKIIALCERWAEELDLDLFRPTRTLEEW